MVEERNRLTMKADTSILSSEVPVTIKSSKKTLRRGTAEKELTAAAEGRTFLVYRNGLSQGKKIALSVGSHTSKHACDDGTVFLLDPGVKIGLPTNEECYPDAIKFLMVIVTRG